MDAEELRRRRDRALRHLLVAVVVLLLFGFGYGFSAYLAAGGAGVLLFVFSPEAAAVVLGAALAYGSWSALRWAYWGRRLRKGHDPWAYDPELDGPGRGFAAEPERRRGKPPP